MDVLYKLHLTDSSSVRVAVYNTQKSTLTWEDTNEPLIDPLAIHHESVAKVSPQSPSGKSMSLKKIKIQVGFACNFSCLYCSQNNQRIFQKDGARQALNKVDRFLEKMDKWFDGGTDGLGAGVRLEFWGGETLLYWEAVEKLARALRTRYPNINLALFTNGSLVTKEMANISAEIRLHFIVSHDGPTFSQDRAMDPFDVPVQRENLHYLFRLLGPLNLISFNATISPKNFSLLEIRKYIAAKLEAEVGQVKLSYDLATPYDSAGMNYVANKETRKNLINGIFFELCKQYPADLSVGMVSLIVHDFFESIKSNRPADAVGQKCSMDLPSSIAVDMDGNVLTCQNVTANGGHRIGHVEQFSEIKLSTSYHWSHRSECTRCPVVQICKGSCMFLTEDLWRASCDQHFTWGMAYLGFALYLHTNRYLTKVEGSNIRGSGENAMEVLQFNGK